MWKMDVIVIHSIIGVKYILKESNGSYSKNGWAQHITLYNTL